MKNSFDIDPEEKVEHLKCGLREYYGTAMMSGFPIAVIELSKVNYASDEEIIDMAKQAGII
jgi:hypothetical protein